MTVYKKLADVQKELKAPKNQYNSFGKYKYRSLEDITEAAKPLCIKHNLVLSLSDEIKLLGDRYYVEATAMVTDLETGDTAYVKASARESENKKGMDDSQITGTASSYARKYACNGLFAIDDTKDADTDEHTKQTKPRKASQKQMDEIVKLVEAKGGSYDSLETWCKDRWKISFKDITTEHYEACRKAFSK